MPEWSSNDLNEEQESAITYDGNVLLIACPGSGKTRTLVYKLAYELERIEDRRKFIIAITYTHRAADEIKERIEYLGTETKQLWIGTIHSFCLEWILKPYSLYSNELKNGFRIINSFDSEQLLGELCEPYKFPRIGYYDCNYHSSPTGIKLACNDPVKLSGVKEILSKYFDTLTSRRQIDFELILYHSFQILESQPLVAQILSNLFSFIMMDEYQDTKEIQYHIVSKILNAGEGRTKSFIVGDPNQSIFDSLGGYPIKNTDLELLTGLEFNLMHLSKNYRSSSKVIDFFDHFKTYENNISAHGKDKDYESIITFNRSIIRDELEDEIVRLITININEYGIKPNEICIIAPQWVHLADLTRKLMIRLPDYSFDGPGMAPFARDIDNFWYKVAKVALTEPSPQLYLRRLRWAREIIDDLDRNGVKVDHLSAKSLLKLFNSIELDEKNGLDYLQVFFATFLSSISVKLESYVALKEHHESFFESSKARIARLAKDGNEFIASVENFRKVFKQKDGITISSIHGIKGAEYDTVISFALLEDYLPHFSDPNKRINSKKMLYVIGSRARKNLHLISEKGRLKPFGSPPEEHATNLDLANYTYTYSEL